MCKNDMERANHDKVLPQYISSISLKIKTLNDKNDILGAICDNDFGIFAKHVFLVLRKVFLSIQRLQNIK